MAQDTRREMVSVWRHHSSGNPRCAFAAIPFLDRGRERRPWRRPVVVAGFTIFVPCYAASAPSAITTTQGIQMWPRSWRARNRPRSITCVNRSNRTCGHAPNRWLRTHYTGAGDCRSAHSERRRYLCRWPLQWLPRRKGRRHCYRAGAYRHRRGSIPPIT